MPTPQQILDGLEGITNDWRTLAIFWHVALGAGLIALGAGWRPGRRLAGVALAFPLATVSLLAWLSGNPFNGSSFAIIAGALVAAALRLAPGPIQISPPFLLIAGVVLTAFGWTYPHFLRADSWVAYLYAAPLGLIPCPTLSAVIGIALMIRGLGSRALCLILAGSGALYGLIGWFRLGVTVDAVLLVGAILLAFAWMFRFGGTKAS